MEHHADSLLPMKAVLKLTGLRSRTSIYRLIDKDDNFPRPVRLGTRGTRFRQSEVDAWIRSLPTKRRFGKRH